MEREDAEALQALRTTLRRAGIDEASLSDEQVTRVLVRLIGRRGLQAAEGDPPAPDNAA